MNKLIYLTLLTYVLLSIINISAAFPANDELVPALYKRNKKCDCTFAAADFDLKKSFGPVKGFMAFSQDESGSTIISGIFSKGFHDTNSTNKYLIVDSCGTVLHDLTEGLCVTLSGDGGTNSFRHKFDNINLNCDNKGVLLAETEGNSLPKRNCKSLSKRDVGGDVLIMKDGGSYSHATLT